MTTKTELTPLAIGILVANVKCSDLNELMKSTTIEALECLAEILRGSEPIATRLQTDPEDDREGLWFSLDDIEKLLALPAGTKLYTHPQPVKKCEGETQPYGYEFRTLREDGWSPWLKCPTTETGEPLCVESERCQVRSLYLSVQPVKKCEWRRIDNDGYSLASCDNPKYAEMLTPRDKFCQFCGGEIVEVK